MLKGCSHNYIQKKDVFAPKLGEIKKSVKRRSSCMYRSIIKRLCDGDKRYKILSSGDEQKFNTSNG